MNRDKTMLSTGDQFKFPNKDAVYEVAYIDEMNVVHSYPIHTQVANFTMHHNGICEVIKLEKQG